MKERGQITIEAMLIIGLFILILVGISVPMAFRAKDSAADVTIVSDAKYASEQIASAANSIATPGAKRNISVYIPGLSTTARTITTTIGVDTAGSNLVTSIAIPGEEAHVITSELYGDNWQMSNISESSGSWYNIVMTWKSINWTET